MNAFDYFFENTSSSDRLFLTGKEEIKHRDLHRSCNKIAYWIGNNTGPARNILLLSVNNLFLIKAYLSIIKSGNICIPLDPGIEKENLDYILEHTKPAMVFSTPDLITRLHLDTSKCITPEMISEIELLKGLPLDIKTKAYNSETCAEIIFTSGSTGKPKGVMISHKNLIANTASIADYLNLTSDDRMLVVLPFYYCYGLSLLHTHLRVGGSIVLNNSFIFMGKIIKDLLDYKCTGFAGVPSHFQILLRKSDSFKTTKFPDLKYVTQAGGKLAPVFIDEFRENFPEIKFIVMYGQTEATARLSYLPAELYEKKRGSMGRGIPGVELVVVNESGDKIKPGETGEVIARGDNIMLGYFNDAEGTSNTIKEGWLHTGDLGTIDDEGYIFLTARKKEMIKVRGKRISPKEIEAVILALPDVIDCTVEGIEDNIQGEMIKASVNIRKESKSYLNVEYLKRHCSKHLSLYKIPNLFEIIDEISISSTGKKIKNVSKNIT